MNYPIFAQKEVFETMQVFTFHSSFKILGQYVGNINDEDFAKKLNRVRGRLWLNNVNYSESPSAFTVKAVKRMNDQERYNRKMSKVWAEYWRQIDKCTGLFRDEEIRKLGIRYKSTVTALKERYGT